MTLLILTINNQAVDGKEGVQFQIVINGRYELYGHSVPR